MIEQRTQEWKDARAGNVTASRINEVMTLPRKGQKDSAVRKAYMAQIICERLTGKAIEESKGNFWDVQRGNDLESSARTQYDLRRGVAVQTAGFVKHPTIPMAGCSPDGYVAPDGMVQIKAPRRHVHLDWIMAGVVPSEHKRQMYFELSCHPERKWNDFVSYAEDLPDHLQLFIVRLYPDPVEIEKINSAVAKFNAEVEEIIAKLPKVEGQTSLEVQLQESLKHVRGEALQESIA
jgi:hypothetical protein